MHLAPICGTLESTDIWNVQYVSKINQRSGFWYKQDSVLWNVLWRANFQHVFKKTKNYRIVSCLPYIELDGPATILFSRRRRILSGSSYPCSAIRIQPKINYFLKFIEPCQIQNSNTHIASLKQRTRQWLNNVFMGNTKIINNLNGWEQTWLRRFCLGFYPLENNSVRLSCWNGTRFLKVTCLSD